MDVGAVYAEGRERVSGLVAELDVAGAATVVPACPAWSVKDVLAHLTGICADIMAGNIEGVATDPWTAAQVDARRSATIGEVVAEWNEVAPQVEAMAAGFGPAGHQWVGDFATHEHDVRGALGRPGARDSQASPSASSSSPTASWRRWPTGACPSWPSRRGGGSRPRARVPPPPP